MTGKLIRLLNELTDFFDDPKPGKSDAPLKKYREVLGELETFEQRYGDVEKIGDVFTFAIVVRGQPTHIHELIDFLKTSDLVIAHHQIGQEKMYIRKGEYNDTKY